MRTGRFSGEELVETWDSYDALGTVWQKGAIPALEAAGT